MSKEINILIADDHQMFIDGIKSLLRKETHIKIVGEVANGLEALDFLETQQVDLLITDINMPMMDGLKLVSMVRNDPNYKEA